MKYFDGIGEVRIDYVLGYRPYFGKRGNTVVVLLCGGDTKVIAVALGNIARAKGMTKIAREAGITREALYLFLSEKGDPQLSTLLGVMKALGLQLGVRK